MSDTEKKYAEFSHSFEDPWSGEEISLTFRLAKPNKLHIKRMQDSAAKNAGQASRNLLFDLVHPDDKDALTQAAEDYPGIITSFATAVIKGVGIADLGK